MSKSFDISLTQTFKAIVSDAFTTEARRQLVVALETLSEIPVNSREPEVRVAIRRCEELLAMSEEEMVKSIMKQALRDGLRDELLKVLQSQNSEGIFSFAKFAPALVTVTSREK